MRRPRLLALLLALVGLALAAAEAGAQGKALVGADARRHYVLALADADRPAGPAAELTGFPISVAFGARLAYRGTLRSRRSAVTP